MLTSDFHLPYVLTLNWLCLQFPGVPNLPWHSYRQCPDTALLPDMWDTDATRHEIGRLNNTISALIGKIVLVALFSRFFLKHVLEYLLSITIKVDNCIFINDCPEKLKQYI